MCQGTAGIPGIYHTAPAGRRGSLADKCSRPATLNTVLAGEEDYRWPLIHPLGQFSSIQASADSAGRSPIASRASFR